MAENTFLHDSIVRLFSDFKKDLISLFDKYQPIALHQVQQPLPPPPSLPPASSKQMMNSNPSASMSSNLNSLLSVSNFIKGSSTNFSRDTAIFDWSPFTLAPHQRFGPPEFEDPAGALMKLTQTTTVLASQAAFEDLSSLVIGLTPTLLTSSFLSGLKPHIRRALIPQRPHDPGGGLDIQFSWAYSQHVSHNTHLEDKVVFRDQGNVTDQILTPTDTAPCTSLAQGRETRNKKMPNTLRQ